MEKKRIYCIGNCKNISHEDASKWRRDVNDFFYDEVKVVNICDYYSYEEKLHNSDKEIEDFCIRNVKNADAVIVNASMLWESVGSHCEIMAAKLFNVPVFIFAEEYEEIYPWFIDWAERIESGDGALERICEHVNYYVIEA